MKNSFVVPHLTAKPLSLIFKNEHIPLLKNVINKGWNWIGIHAKEVIMINPFGNVVFLDGTNTYYRICPEELSCQLIAQNYTELKKLYLDPEFQIDWNMEEYVKLAESKHGKLELDQKYCLKLPAVIGGKYELENFGINSFEELIRAAGNLAFQIRDQQDGQHIKLQTTND